MPRKALACGETTPIGFFALKCEDVDMLKPSADPSSEPSLKLRKPESSEPSLRQPRSKLDPDARLRRARWMWYGLALVSVLLGLWGTIGGWWFGLPVGGETRRDVFDGSHLRYLLTAIPDPDLGNVPIVLSGADVYQRNPYISWDVRPLPTSPAPLSLPPTPSKSDSAPPSKAPLVTQAPTILKDNQPPSPPAPNAPHSIEPLTEYVTNVSSSSIIVAPTALPAE